MCGLTGFVCQSNVDLERKITSMSLRLAHRGPDDSGIWVDDNLGVALGHRRLSILDLSPQGHQPMISSSGRFIIAYNGEIYNHNEIRERLTGENPGISWRGHSDTEVLLTAIQTWGLRNTLEQCVGMFAIALWDRQESTLCLARDRCGEKPLYYGVLRDAFVFASEIKAIEAFSRDGLAIDRKAIGCFLRHGCIPAPQSIYENVRKLPPGSYLTVRAPRPGRFEFGDPQKFWSLSQVIEESRNRESETWTDQRAVDELERRLGHAVRLQMEADVPLGAFLSGGIDSSTIVALMQAQASQPVKTFTIGFHEEAYNEARYAKEIARHLGTDHTELYVNATEAARVIPQLPDIYDEPFADASQIPTYVIARLTRKHVTVSLSGDGGDELFGGYPRYQFGAKLWSGLSRIPTPVRRLAARPLTMVSARTWDAGLARSLPERYRSVITGHRLHRLAGILSAGSFDEMYTSLISHWQEPGEALAQSDAPASCGQDWRLPESGQNWLNRMRYADFSRYLPDDLLVKVDRASMANSLESRAPFLDHRVVELALGLPSRFLVRDGQGKWILRQLLNRSVPLKLVDRPKTGFGIPLAEWLRGPLRDWAGDLLGEAKLRSEGFFSASTVRRIWKEHLEKTHDRSYLLWDVLMFQAWYENRRA
jgi:asparagine synthase (glutamine-hydrolysing)